MSLSGVETSGFGAPAFTAMPTFEIISKVLPLPTMLPLPASSSTTSVLVMTRSGKPCLMSSTIAGSPLKLIFTLLPVAFSNIGISVPSTSGSGPPLATTVISAALAAAPSDERAQRPRHRDGGQFSTMQFMTSSLVFLEKRITPLFAVTFNAAGTQSLTRWPQAGSIPLSGHFGEIGRGRAR